MAETTSLAAEARARAGKGAARGARRAGKVPGVIYGEAQPPVLIAIDGLLLRNKLRDPNFMTHLYDLELDGKKHRVLPRDVQLDPIKDQPLHIDFLRVGEKTTITLDVPVHFLNEGMAPGIKRGGVLNVVRHTIELVCRADSIPEFLEADLTGLEIGDSVRISAIKLGEGVRPAVTGRDFVVATIASPSVVRAEAVEAAQAAAAEAAKPGEEVAAPAAPAEAGGAKPETKTPPAS